jgi:hypothetical protein
VLEGTAFIDCTFEKCDFVDGRINLCRFSNCKFLQCSFGLLTLQRATFDACQIDKTNILEGDPVPEGASQPKRVSDVRVEQNCVVDEPIRSKLTAWGAKVISSKASEGTEKAATE